MGLIITCLLRVPGRNILFTAILACKLHLTYPKLALKQLRLNMVIDDGWVYPLHEAYQPYMVELMEFFHGGVEYPSDKTFTREELLELGPVDVKRWLAHKAYGDPDYNVHKGDRPVYIRSSTLEFAKKSVSFFMPNRLPAWANGSGNPTKSAAVNNLLKEVKQFEVRREGVSDQSMRPVSEREFRMTIHLFQAQDDWNTSWKFMTMALWQYHLIGRIDDVVHFKTDDLKSHARFEFAMQTKVRWSKNVLEERSCPDQILLGSMDPLCCILANMGIYLEVFLGNFPQSTYLFTNNQSNTAPKNLIQAYRSKLETVVIKNPAFQALSATSDTRGVGTHSYRKFPSQYAVDKGASPDDVEIRGRWKKRGHRVVFRYIDPGQIYTDAKVESLLCMGGPIKYKMRPGIGITDEWLFHNLVPHIHQRYAHDPKLCKMFALALLFVAMDESIAMPQEIRDRITTAYATLRLAETHPVIKVPIHIYRIEDYLMIDEAVPLLENIGGGNEAANRIPIQTILVRMDRQERNMADLYRNHEASIQRLERVLLTHISTLNNNIRRFGGTIEGALVIQQGGTVPRTNQRRPQINHAARQQQEQASLCHTPRSLMELWHEFKHGINGGKPAEQFSTAERNSRVGGMKQKYYRRSVVWNCIDRLVRSGFTPQAAVNQIHQAYGHNLSVTQIINLMIRDRRMGGHPNLR